MSGTITWPDKIWFIGCGNMGGAILRAWLDNDLPVANVTVIKPSHTKLPHGLESQSDYPDDQSPDLVLLAMKPYHLADVAEQLAPLVSQNTQVVSILAGTELDILEKKLPGAGQITRLMPNMAVTVGKSPMIFVAKNDDDTLRNQMANLFDLLGPSEWLENEEQMHLATALSGSGPAFLFRFIDALTVSATNLGMARDQAARLALAMVEGAAVLAAGSDHDPGTLASQVAAPGGTTRKGLDVLDADGRMNGLLKDVLKAAMDRNREMAEEAKD